ncbi:WD40/YVTN/BNR-like repeat-containing protein [Paenibacillus sedimenti]|uniref:Glycosyl hydrolase n=1 Tax=Paenibacillus sedimenti TaxID=2770274 RepID=A0A926KXP3_9BACL|nr:glycosyl hydrolase [Paenibacillus sedimenti]MBD0384044.1 glycosyl hydrolase [Paenibacillus sedimenti]
MNRYFLCMPDELVVVDDHKTSYDIQYHLHDKQPTCIAFDPFLPNRLYCGTDGQGLWVSDDGGDHWESTGAEISSSIFTSVSVSLTRKIGDYGVVYAGTELSALFYSEDGGQSWHEWSAVRSLPSYSRWSFPPIPDTHNVRMIAEDPANGYIYASIEAGAVIRTQNGGAEWQDTKEGDPIDAHTLLIHPQAPKRIYAACSDGVGFPGRSVLVSRDHGETWAHDSKGLEQHPYLFSMTAGIHDPDTLLVSASSDAKTAYVAPFANSFIYRKVGNQPWQQVHKGLPPAEGTMISNLTADPNEPDTFYALNNRGLYCSADKGMTWTALPVDWKEKYLNPDPNRRHRSALLVISKEFNS